GEVILQVVFHGLVREVTDKQSILAHDLVNLLKKPGGRICTGRDL
ncbi:MAG: hypothetical protein JWM68_2602, partial [Verrucomicrobiales bacterium]|nr:hypothetical protein [Verrucomicrobiales bacterium]